MTSSHSSCNNRVTELDEVTKDNPHGDLTEDEEQAMDVENEELAGDGINVLSGKKEPDERTKLEVEPMNVEHWRTLDTWTHIHERFDKITQNSTIDQEDLVKLLSIIPYAKENSGYSVVEFGNLEDLAEEEDDAIMKELSAAKKQNNIVQIIAIYERLLQRQHKREKLLKYLNKVQIALTAVHGKLLILSGLSQAKASCALTEGTSTHVDLEYEMDLETLPARLEIYKDCFDEKKELVHFNDIVKEGTPALHDLTGLNKGHQEALRKFNTSFQCYFKEAKAIDGIVPKKDSAVKKDVQKDEKDKKSTKIQVDEKKYNDSLLFLEDLLLNPHENRERCDKEKFIPAPSSNELNCTQPYLLVLLRALGSILNDKPPPGGGSSAKAHVMNNRVIPGTKFRPKRTVDKTISANTRFIFMFRDDAIELAVEEKSLFRASENPEKLIRGARDQILSHCAKHLGVSFNFAGKGIDSRATGVVINPACVIILQLRLVQMGTKEVKLVLLETDYLPLLSEENFDVWATLGASNTKAISEFKKRLYPTSAIATDVPAGLVALAKLMTTSRRDLVGPRPFQSETLGEMLGFGSFGTVWEYKHTEKKNQVIKLSRYGAKSGLDYEAKVLRELDCRSGCIPRWVRSDDLEVAIGGVSVALPALVMEPRGISIEMELAQMTEGESQQTRLVSIGKELVHALSFIHEKGFHHHDVSPKNIMFDSSTGKTFLIDFGLAAKKNEKLYGFYGTTLYAHSFIFGMYPRKLSTSMPEYDYTSLALSMAVLSENGRKCPWKQFSLNETDGFDYWKRERSNTAWNCLKGADFDEAVWKKWCMEE